MSQGAPRVRIALLGCGAMGEEVARRVYTSSGRGEYEVAAVIDSRPERARALGAALAVGAYTTLDSASESSEFEAVDIRLPHQLHVDAAIAALGQGWHVLVEKPVATSMADGERLRKVAGNTDLVVAVAENYPHLLAVRAAQRTIGAGDLGTLRALRTTRAYTLGDRWLRDGWRRGTGPAAGILLDQGTHHTSLLRQLGGEIVAVSARATTTSIGDGGETVSLTVVFASGVVGQSLYSWGTPSVDDDAEAIVYASKGRVLIRVSYEGKRGRAYVSRDSKCMRSPISDPEDYYDSHRSIIEDWTRSIRSGGKPLVTIDGALADLQVVEGALRSLQNEGQFVDLSACRTDA
jgi:UDP-N-acetyl-2-amino-2-deoxyglucuronate dehydrogenase